MTTNHIDQLAEWWTNAEIAPVLAGDTFICYTGWAGYFVRVADEDLEEADCRRVLSRAPKPKPAWHNAPAIIATWYDRTEDEAITGVWTHDAGVWKHEDGVCVDATALTDVTPLIEAKVTDEARERVWRVIQKYTGEDDRHRPDYAAEIDGYITAALGLETE